MKRFFEIKAKEIMDASTLLMSVEQGNQSQVELLTQLNPRSIIYKDELISTPRSFSLISAFELAAWNLDMHMCYAMLYNSLCFLPSEEEAEGVRAVLLEQAETLDLIGIKFQFKGALQSQSHYDFSELTVSFYTFLAAFKDAFKQWPQDKLIIPAEVQKPLWEELNQLWGNYNLAQQHAPTHVRQHYNDPNVAFRDPIPDFNLMNEFNRTGVTLEWSAAQHRRGYSDEKFADKSLARAIIRSKQKAGGYYSSIPQLDFKGGWQQDIIAIERLRDTRQRNWEEMKVLLKQPIREIIQTLEERYKKELPLESACPFP